LKSSAFIIVLFQNTVLLGKGQRLKVSF